MKIHDRYILREILGPFVISMSACAMMMTVQQLYTVMQLLQAHRLAMASLGLYLLYRLPMTVQKALPVALLLGSSLGISRMMHDGELSPIRMGGLPLWRFLSPLALMGLLCSGVSYYLGENVTPYSDHQAEAIYRQLTFQSAVAGLQPDTFFRSDNRLYYFHMSYPGAAGRSHLIGVIIYQLSGQVGDPTAATVADTARETTGPVVFWAAEAADVDGQTWSLYGVRENQLSATGEIVGHWDYPTMRIDLHRNIQYFLADQQTPQELTRSDLLTRIEADERLALPRAVILPLAYEYSFRLALPFACLVFSLVSAPLTVRFSRGGSLVGILVAFGVLFFYYDVMVIGEKLALSSAVPPSWAAWIPNILFGILGLFLISREP